LNFAQRIEDRLTRREEVVFKWRVMKARGREWRHALALCCLMGLN